MTNSSRAAIASAVLVALLFAIVIAVFFSFHIRLNKLDAIYQIPILAIGSIVILVLIVALVALLFAGIGLQDGGQALALPEGSIRAIIALILLVIFAVFPVFLYLGLSEYAGTKSVPGLSEDEKNAFLKDNPKLPSVVVKHGPSDQAGGKPTFDIDYQIAKTPASEDFAKQILTLVGTLVTAVTAFYFGAKTATSAAASAVQSQDSKTLAPLLRSIDPPVFAMTSPATSLTLSIAGENLNSVKEVNLIGSGIQIAATQVVSNNSLVQCIVDATKLTYGKYDVTVIDAGSKSVSLASALTVA